MNEIDELHTKSLEWGCVCNLIDKIANIEDNMSERWDELCDMIGNMVAKEGEEKDPTKIFFDIYQYCFRLYYRLRTTPIKRNFNEIHKTTIAGKEVYRIENYDYNTFKWAKNGGFNMTISNDYIDLPSEKLTINQRQAFDRRIGKQENG